MQLSETLAQLLEDLDSSGEATFKDRSSTIKAMVPLWAWSGISSLTPANVLTARFCSMAQLLLRHLKRTRIDRTSPRSYPVPGLTPYRYCSVHYGRYLCPNFSFSSESWLNSTGHRV